MSSFTDHLKKSADIVDSWPYWKKGTDKIMNVPAMDWIDLEKVKPPHVMATALSRCGEYETERHIKTWISDGVSVWIGRINFGSESIDGYEDEDGSFCTHWGEYEKPSPSEYVKPGVERDREES